MSKEKKKYNKDQNHVRYFDPKSMTPEEMMEDYFSEEDAAIAKEMIDNGWKIAGIVNKDTPREDIDNMIANIAHDMKHSK